MIVYCDEVGCASIAGPLVVCAVADNGSRPVAELKDSKAYSQKRREALYEELFTQLLHSYGSADIKTIEKVNIHFSKFDAMKQAVTKLAIKYGIPITKVVIDGNFTIPNLDIPQQAIIKADETLWCCSAASILAKVTRDRMMTNLGEIFQGFSWHKNKGYFSPEHLEGVIRNGLTPLHRKGFKYTRYCAWEREEFLKSGQSADDFCKFVKNYKDDHGVSRFQEWGKMDKSQAKWGEQRW